MAELRKRNEELSKSYTYDTSMGENNIPVTNSTSNRVTELPDLKLRTIGSGKPGYNRRKIETIDTRKEKSNLVTNNPFVPKKKFKMPKLKFSGKGKRTIMRGKIK